MRTTIIGLWLWLLAGGALPCPGAELPSPADPHVARAMAHLKDQGAALGLRPGSDFAPLRVRTRDSRHYVRLGQTHGGIPVFGAQAVVQMDDAGQVVFVLPDLAHSPDLDRLTPAPRVTAEGASTAAIAWASRENPGVAFTVRPPALQIFAPEVLGATGAPRLVWNLEIGPAEPGHPGAAHRLLLDALDGAVVRAYPLAVNVLDRDVYDSQNSNVAYKVIARREGWPATGIPDVDENYDYLGDVYLFYAYQYGRDGWDNSGHKAGSDVRYCKVECPYNNAFWDSFYDVLMFGPGWAKDDVTAHEFTHAVTDFESNLIYENTSGAINESLSDIFGEFVDLTNGRGNDAPSVRWLCSEEVPGGAIRDMRNPPAFEDPDRLGSPFYIPPVGDPNLGNDQGGVHTNSGVPNKLCSLLTDGGTFNGEAVNPTDLYAVAALFYEANTNLLVPGSGWTELYYALRQAAVNLGWTAAQRTNLERACAAVEISILFVDNTTACIQTGVETCGLFSGPYQTVGAGVAAMYPGTRVRIRGGNYPELPSLNKGGRFEAHSGAVRIGP